MAHGAIIMNVLRDALQTIMGTSKIVTATTLQISQTWTSLQTTSRRLGLNNAPTMTLSSCLEIGQSICALKTAS